jgi:uncharacterized protein YbaR (Trm112 family)
LWLARSAALSGIVCRRVVDCLEKHLRSASQCPFGLTGAVLFMQRFGSGANLNVHLHVVALDGSYERKSTGRLKFYNATAPTPEAITALVTDIAKRVNNHLLRKGYLEKQEDLMLLGNTEDLFAQNDDNLHLPAQAASVAHRIAFGLHAGEPVRRLRTAHSSWPSEDDVEVSSHACVSAGGYSVHAATAVKGYERDRLERLVRYMARPAIADERLSLMPNGDIKLKLKTPWRDGSEFLLFTPTEFIEKLVALIPLRRFHLTRYYGVLASRSSHRKHLPDRPESKTVPQTENSDAENQTAATGPQKFPHAKGQRGKRHLSWAELLKRTFAIDILACPKCNGRMALVAVVFDRKTIEATLIALGVSPRAPPIAPPRSDGIFTCDDFVCQETRWDDAAQGGFQEQFFQEL